MLDEWLEGYIDKLCETLPEYRRPRKIAARAHAFIWRFALYGEAFKRSVWGALSSIEWVEKEEAPQEVPQEEPACDPVLEKLDPQTKRDIEAWNEQQKAWEEKNKEKSRKRRPLLRAIKEWYADQRKRLKAWKAAAPERARKSEERWQKREQEAEKRAQANMHRMVPLMEAVKKSRFAALLLLTVFCMLGVCARGGGGIGFLAAACCTMWLAIAVETGYEPVAGGVRQRYMAAMALRAGSYLMALPMYFGGYARQGVTSNVILQGAMLIALFAHAVLYLALVAFNRRQPLFLRILSGLLGMIPALSASAAIAFAVSQMALPMPAAAASMLGALGALLAFCADELGNITELGGIRLRYTPLWHGLFLEAGFLLMVLGAWIN